jgi:hypothetical protein
MSVQHTLILRIWFATQIFIGHPYSYMLVLHTLIYHAYILLYVDPVYSYNHILNMPVLYTSICRSYILLSTCPIYLYMPVKYTPIYRF